MTSNHSESLPDEQGAQVGCRMADHDAEFQGYDYTAANGQFIGTFAPTRIVWNPWLGWQWDAYQNNRGFHADDWGGVDYHPPLR